MREAHCPVVHEASSKFIQLDVYWTMCGIEYCFKPTSYHWQRAANTRTVAAIMKRTKCVVTCLRCLHQLSRGQA